MLKLIDRLEILRKKGDLTRQGLRPAHVGYASAYRVRERLNMKVIQPMQSTTFKSPLTSQVYFSVFCEGHRTEKTRTHGSQLYGFYL